MRRPCCSPCLSCKPRKCRKSTRRIWSSRNGTPTKKIEEIEYSGSRQKWRKRYEYGADGKVSRELIYNEYNKLEAVKKYTYNEFGRKHTQYNYDGRGKLQTIKVFEYITQDV